VAEDEEDEEDEEAEDEEELTRKPQSPVFGQVLLQPPDCSVSAVCNHWGSCATVMDSSS
jgi:hypothetical protein